jgi:putative transposase
MGFSSVVERRGDGLKFTSRRPYSAHEGFITESYLLITAGTFQKKPFINSDERKSLLLESLDFNCYKWDWRLLAFAILDNHYHLIVQTPQGDTSRLAHIIQSAHSYSAYHWRREDSSIRNRIWWNFWESPLETKDALLQHINYLHENPRFHGLTDDPQNYPFSSYNSYLEVDTTSLRQWEHEYPANGLQIIDSF